MWYLTRCGKKLIMFRNVPHWTRRPPLKALRMARADAGLTISELAKRAGVSRDTISAAERGHHGLQASTLSKLARALNKTPSELLAEEERLTPKVESQSSPEPSLSKDVEEWLATHGHRDEDQFRDYVSGLDLGIDEEGRPRGLEEAIAELRHTRDRLLEDLKSWDTRTTLFPRRSGLPTRDERIREALRPAKEAWNLEWKIRHEYLAREIELINHGRGLLDGAAEYEPRLDELLEEAYAQASAA
jgi:transcriptional regulator with XRE-family HTH domain